MTDRKITGIQKVTVNSVDETNIMDVDIWAVTEEGNEDLVEVIFLANIIEGVAFKQWAKGWLVQLVHDGFTDVYDSYIADDAKGPVIPNFSITFDIVTAGVIGTEIWTFQANKSYIFNRDDVQFELDQKRTPGGIFVLCIGTVAVTHP